MKKLMVAVALVLASGVAVAENCSTKITYTITDSSGVVRDYTEYQRNWPLTCKQQVEGKYAMQDVIFGQGKARFTELTSGSNN